MNITATSEQLFKDCAHDIRNHLTILQLEIEEMGKGSSQLNACLQEIENIEKCLDFYSKHI